MARRLHAIFYWMLDSAPVGLRLVIIVDAEVIVAVPVPTGALVVLRRFFELVLGKVGPISAGFCIILQERPRRGVSAVRNDQPSRANSLVDRTGNHFDGTGNSVARTGNLVRKIRNRRRVRFSVHTGPPKHDGD